MSETRELKLVLIGNANVGKTCVVKKATTSSFSEDSVPTLGASYVSKAVTCGRTEVRLQIWDTAGQERYRGMTPMYFRGAHAAIIMYSLTDQESFTAIDSWISSLRDNADPNIIMFLVGNKQDLAAEARVVSTESGEQKAAEIKAEFCEVSAKTGYGVDDLFMNITRRFVESSPEIGNVEEETVDLKKAHKKKDGKKNCC